MLEKIPTQNQSFAEITMQGQISSTFLALSSSSDYEDCLWVTIDGFEDSTKPVKILIDTQEFSRAIERLLEWIKSA